MTPDIRLRLWSDEPSAVDLLAFQAVADTVAEAVLDDSLDPLAVGVSGPWGSGKTTVLRLLAVALKERGAAVPGERLLAVSTDPWRYDPTVGAKESLITEVLGVLAEELESNAGAGDNALKLLKKLAKRVDWAKALRTAAKASLTFQLPNIDDLTSLIHDKSEADQVEARGLEAFREEFARLMDSDELKEVKRVVVLVDDLDRCLPETVIETLEAIRLFLAVPKMAFVIAADEERVADAIKTRYPKSGADLGGEEAEEPAKLYLHKIVQTTIPLPALSRFDTEAFLVLLQLQNRVENTLDAEQFGHFVNECTGLRLKAADLDDLTALAGVDISSELSFAARLTPILYEKLRGNPRRIKRFLNDLSVRQAIAGRRGITLEPAVVAKLMVLELLFPEEFKTVLGWLAHGELRVRIDALEEEAGRPAVAVSVATTRSAAVEGDGKRKPPPPKPDEKDREEAKESSDNFIRWAKLPPQLRGIDLSPYLHLAASFVGAALLDRELPERLRDLAANLLSSVRSEQKSVQEADLTALSPSDATELLKHLGRMGRDRLTDQRKAVTGILRIAKVQSSCTEAAANALVGIPADDVQLPVLLLFKMPDHQAFRPVLERWKTETSKDTTKSAVDNALKPQGGLDGH